VTVRISLKVWSAPEIVKVVDRSVAFAKLVARTGFDGGINEANRLICGIGHRQSLG
jgi:hypothetical protein